MSRPKLELSLPFIDACTEIVWSPCLRASACVWLSVNTLIAEKRAMCRLQSVATQETRVSESARASAIRYSTSTCVPTGTVYHIRLAQPVDISISISEYRMCHSVTHAHDDDGDSTTIFFHLLFVLSRSSIFTIAMLSFYYLHFKLYDTQSTPHRDFRFYIELVDRFVWLYAHRSIVCSHCSPAKEMYWCVRKKYSVHECRVVSHKIVMFI